MATTKQRRSLVTLLDSMEITREARQSCLNETEKQEAGAISNRVRREDWIAGRIASKWAFLSSDPLADTSEPSALCLQKLGRPELASFTAEQYRSVSVIRDQGPSGGPARIGWSSGSGTARAAISHCAGIACASVDTAGVCSLDLETPAQRVREFYRQTFTDRERHWVRACAGSYGFDPDWLYTLLWSTRECLLKMPRFTALSLWHMPALELDICGAERLAGIFHAKELSSNFELFDASTSGFLFQLAVAGNPNLILTAVTGHDYRSQA